MCDNRGEMRAWLVVLLALALLVVLPRINTRSGRARYPLLKRVDDTINILTVFLLGACLAGIVAWLLKR